ncbi:hypothetical protein [Pedobacter deserti]|uniref:hypothetical protein n=1 Tax=Pedobacter deserti TaxID=2817382 RepID=UPI00210DA898|nr:hypothetical protein [Pedobacter sp. SYSU D00382]
MPILNVGEYIARKEIQECVTLFQKIQSGREPDKTIYIKASKKVLGVDFLLMTYAALFKLQIKDLKITVDLPFNPVNLTDDKFQYFLMQAGTYTYLSSGVSPFLLLLGTSTFNFDLKRARAYPERWLVNRKDFFPFLHITADQESFDALFDSPLQLKIGSQLDRLPKEVIWQSSSEDLRKALSYFILMRSPPKDREQTLVNLAISAFYRSLDEAKALHFYFEDEYTLSNFDGKKKIQAGSLVNATAYDYYRSIKPVFYDLSNRSLIYHFVFSTLISSESLVDKESDKDVLNEDTKERFTTKIFELWDFTKDLVAGLRELAKNIRDHADPPTGAITIRRIGETRFAELQEQDIGNLDVYRSYNQFLKQGAFGHYTFLDINVVDLGTKGVVSTLIVNSESLIQNADSRDRISNLITEDIRMLKDGSVGFQNLLDTEKQQLNQQSKRSIAHFGLLSFSKLIQTNKGLIIASTYDQDSSKRTAAVVPKKHMANLNPITLGTNYRIILPIRRSEAYRTILPHAPSIPLETTARDVKGIEELLTYEVVYADDPVLLETLGKDLYKTYILIVQPKLRAVRSRIEEQKLWIALDQTMNSIPSTLSPQRLLVCLDLEETDLDESSLFRLLGNWELHHPTLQLAVSNIKNETYLKLIALNGDFSKGRNLDYWNSNIATIIYSYIEISTGRFYFADVLWGKQRADFINMNWIVNQTSFNSTTLSSRKRLKHEVDRYGELVRTNTGVAFYNNSTLLPFDLIFKGIGSTTLFEHNARVLLQNEIKLAK